MNNYFSTEDVTESNRVLHTPSSFAKQYLLYLQEAGVLKSLQPHRCVREKLDSFLFMVVLEGSGSITIQDRTYSIKSGDCAFIDCLSKFEHESSSEDAWKLAWVHFNGVSARGYYNLFLQNTGESNVFTTKQTDKWLKIINDILAAQEQSVTEGELHTGELLLHLLNSVMNELSISVVSNKKSEKTLAGNLREFINEHFSSKNVLEELSFQFAEKVPSLDLIFRRYFGISIDEYVSNRRFNAAKEMLRFSVMTIEEVAKESGIGDIIAMQQMFRQSENMSCEEYRSKWAAWVRH